jgi:LPXTG-site transpeptidase (sortase) family protein
MATRAPPTLGAGSAIATTTAPVAAATPAAAPVPLDAAIGHSETVGEGQPAPTGEALPAGVEALVSIVSVGIDQPIVLGGQAVIDRGVVAHYTAPGWEAAVAPGAPGTYWLAAHHESHGRPFAALPDVAVGAEIRVTTRGQTFVYTVTAMEVVGLQPGDEAVYGSDPNAAVILLQTCIDNTRRLLVHGTLTDTIMNSA